MDLNDAGSLALVRFLIRDRDGKYPVLINEILADTGITTVLTGVRTPSMNSIMERWVKTLRVELLDRMLIWNEAHLRHALREYERHYNLHRTHRSWPPAGAIAHQHHPHGSAERMPPVGIPPRRVVRPWRRESSQQGTQTQAPQRRA